MAMKLRIGSLLDERPVRLAIELPAAVHRDLVSYAEAVARETGQAIEPAKLVAPMLARFMASDRAFAKNRRATPLMRSSDQGSTEPGEERAAELRSDEP